MSRPTMAEIEAARAVTRDTAKVRTMASMHYQLMCETHGPSDPRSAQAWQDWMAASSKDERAQDHLLALVVHARNYVD